MPIEVIGPKMESLEYNLGKSDNPSAAQATFNW